MNESHREFALPFALLLTPAALGASDVLGGAAFGVLSVVMLGALSALTRWRASAPLLHTATVLVVAAIGAAADVALRALSWSVAMQLQPWLPLLALSAWAAFDSHRTIAREPLPLWSWGVALLAPLLVGAARTVFAWPWLGVPAAWLLFGALLLVALACWQPPPIDTPPQRTRRVRVTGPVS